MRLPFVLLGLLAGMAHAAAPPNRATATIPSHPTRTHLPRVEGPHDRDAPLVVIDAGHGGHDPGSSATDGTREKDVSLKIAQAIRIALLESGRVRVALTRDDDRFLILADRREIARALDADLFLSVHCDSAPNPAARGASIYTLSQRSSDKVAASLAARENKADVLNGVDLSAETSDVSSILIDLAQRETLNDAATYASLLGRELTPLIGLKSAFHRSAGLMVLKAPDVPSVLIESGYISNDADLTLLKSRAYRRDLALGVARATEAYFARRLVNAGGSRETMR